MQMKWKNLILCNRRNGTNGGSSESRSPSPTSSQQSGLHDTAGGMGGMDDCDELDECEDSQSINGGANGEWTYEEQFKQVN